MHAAQHNPMLHVLRRREFLQSGSRPPDEAQALKFYAALKYRHLAGLLEDGHPQSIGPLPGYRQKLETSIRR